MKIGCVYFIKHKNYSPIKIGFSSNDLPKCRINCMQTYSPYGVEVIGIILCEQPKIIEKEIHEKYKDFRLNGEWFDIEIDVALETIKLYNSKSLVKNKETVLPVLQNSMYADVDNKILNTYERFCKIYTSGTKINKKVLAAGLGVSRQTIYDWMSKSVK